MMVPLQHPESSYPPRLSRFLALMEKVRSLKPLDLHLWRVMDSVAFQDTETALETALYNERRNRKKQNS